ncbi:MAG: NUDIX hydrolase [Candidatus Thorarchaeota archaeon]
MPKARILNDITNEEYEDLVSKFGEPRKFHFAADFLDFECDLVRRSSTKGRQHDITCFIPRDDGYVTIQKHAYKKSGIYRAPSGGAHLGEPLEDAARREMKEETGLDIELERFVLDLTLDVKCPEGTIPWRSLVFLANEVGGEMKPIDTFEIFDVKVSSREEMLGDISTLMNHSGWGGFLYRAFLTKKFFEVIDQLHQTTV